MLNSLGNVYRHIGKWEQALSCHNLSLDGFLTIDDIQGAARTWGNLGLLYQAQGDRERAASFTARSFIVFSQLGAVEERQQSLQLLISILGNIDAAYTYLAKVQRELQEEMTPDDE